MPWLAPVSLPTISLQASNLRLNLQFQPNAGTVDNRDRWDQLIDRSVSLARTPVGTLAGLVFGDDWNLRRAQRLLNRVEREATASGLLIGDLGGRWESNVSRFGDPGRTLERARLYVLSRKSVRDEKPHEKAQRLVGALFESEYPSYQTLTALLDRAFAAHIRRLDRSVAMVPELVVGWKIPENAAYPRYFEDAHPHLMDFLYRTFEELEGSPNIPWEDCRRETVGELIEMRTRAEGIDPETADDEQRHRGISLASQISEYSSFQLLCLLTQIRDGSLGGVKDALVQELKRARNGRIIELGDAQCAGLTWRHFLEASELVGNIDIIHANIRVAYELAKREQPDVDERIVVLQVQSAVASLGKKTNSSRREYDDAIARLREIEKSPSAGRVIPFSARRKR